MNQMSGNSHKIVNKCRLINANAAQLFFGACACFLAGNWIRRLIALSFLSIQSEAYLSIKTGNG